jgi:hypothetical protein
MDEYLFHVPTEYLGERHADHPEMVRVKSEYWGTPEGSAELDRFFAHENRKSQKKRFARISTRFLKQYELHWCRNAGRLEDVEIIQEILAERGEHG